MQTRLLAFLSDTEKAIRAQKPEPRPGEAWDTSRTVNYSLGLARLMIGFRDAAGSFTQMGGVLLQSFQLADGSLCLKALLTWKGSESEVSHPVYEKPELEWEPEAGRLAAVWVEGPQASGRLTAVWSVASGSQAAADSGANGLMSATG
jgi:hypothetical protein